MMPRLNITPLKLTLGYAAVGAVWVAVDNVIVAQRTQAPRSWVGLETSGELLFVAVTSIVLYSWSRRFRRSASAQTEQLRAAHERSEQARRMYATLSAVNRRIIRPMNRTALKQAICDALIDPGEFRAAWIGRVDTAKAISWPIAAAGGKPPTVIPIERSAGTHDAAALVGEAIRSGQPAAGQDLAAGREELGAYVAQCGIRSGVVIPFHPDTSEPMVLAVYSSEPGCFVPTMIAMLTELVADLEHGIEVIFERERRATAEAALRASEERYRLVTENSHDVIWILSRDGKIQYISPSVQRLLGYAPAEMMKLGFAEFLTPESHRRIDHALRAAIAELDQTGEMQNRLFEVEQVRADGTRVWTEIHTMNLRDDANRWIGILGVTRDITQRRAAEHALASEVARCRALLDVSVDGIHIVDLEGQLLDANEVFLSERGYTREVIPMLHIEDWNAELKRDDILARLRSITSEPLYFETTHRRHDGSAFSIEARAKRVEVEGRTLIYVTTRDVTERRNLEQRLLRAQRLESVGLIASGIAHDLNNVLTPILLSTGLLEMRYRGVDDRALLGPIESAARRGSNIVQQILTFARGAEGERVSIEPKILLKELSTLIRETFPRNIVHRLDVAADASALVGDPTQLHQVFLNLAVNARDAMPEGGTLKIEVRNQRVADDELRRRPSARAGDFVCITVTDTGTGMSHETLDHLFEPFFTTKPRGRGTGLGLSTVHGLVRGHGGFVEVFSQLGHGSDFRVFLPVAPRIEPKTGTIRAPLEQRLGHGEHILVADDEPAILNVLVSILTRHGFVPLTAFDGDEAIAIFDLHAAQIAVVITDVMMPKSDGVRLATEVRHRNARLPIIAMSGMISPTPEEDSREQLRALGVTTILDKPYGESELLRAIGTAMAARNGG